MPKLTEREFAELLRSMPDATEDQVLAAAREAEAASYERPGMWQRLNTGAVSIPDLEVTDQQHPHARFGRRAVNFAGDLVEGLTSPIGATTAALSGGASLAGRAGLLGISRGARLAEAGLNLPFVAEGANTMLNADSEGELAAGALEATLGSLGARGAFKHSFPPAKVRETYLREAGRATEMPTLETKWDQLLAKRTADAFDAMEHAPLDPKVAAAYQSLDEEIQKQYDFLLNRAGLEVSPSLEGYPNSAAMRADVTGNNRMRYFPSEGGFGQGDTMSAENPLLRKDAAGVPTNDKFRVVHDYFGHAVDPNEFGPLGERNAYIEHAAMLPDEGSLAALTTETHGQNSWVNAGKHLRRADGSIPKKGDPDFIPVTERPFAQQKTGLLPKEVIGHPAGTSLAAFAAPAAAPFIDTGDPETDAELRAILLGIGVAGTVGYFNPNLKAKLDVMKADLGKKLKPQMMLTQLRKALIAEYGDKGKRLFNLYTAVELPKVGAVDFDLRTPLSKVTKTVGGKSVPTAEAERRMLLAHERGSQILSAWGDPNYARTVVGDDPKAVAAFIRTLSAFSPGAPTNWNAVQAVEVEALKRAGKDPLQVIREKGMKGFNPRYPRNAVQAVELAQAGKPLASLKIEDLAGLEGGMADAAPVDVWHLRAYGSDVEATPGLAQQLRLKEATGHMAQQMGETTSRFFHKLWSGMQDIGGEKLPSWEEAVKLMDLPAPLTEPGMPEWVLENIDLLKRRVSKKVRTDPQMGFTFDAPYVGERPKVLSDPDFTRLVEKVFQSSREGWKPR